MPIDVDTKDINAVCRECDRIYRSIYEDADAEFMTWACGWFRFIFSGQYKDFLPIDVPYHDKEHTMQGLLCLARLLHGRCEAGADPHLPKRSFELGVLAILMHDTGYLKHHDDVDGTGAKYTLIHVERSRKFAKGFLFEQGCTPAEIEAVQNMIQCTATDVKISDIPFASPLDRTVGCALATADLMGQMSADDYVDRLPHLYAEFMESYEYFGERASRLYYHSTDELISNTPQFWESYVKPKLEEGCDGLYRYLATPYPDGENVYLERIRANIEKAARFSFN